MREKNRTSREFRLLYRSEANAAMLQERFTLIKNERDALDADSKNKLTLLIQKLKELQIQNKSSMEQLHAQSKQCDHLNSENKQLLEYVVCQNEIPRKEKNSSFDFLFFLLVWIEWLSKRKRSSCQTTRVGEYQTKTLGIGT